MSLTLMFYLAMNALVLHGLILLAEVLRPSFTKLKVYRQSDLLEYWMVLLLVACIYRLLKGSIKRFFGIKTES